MMLPFEKIGYLTDFVNKLMDEHIETEIVNFEEREKQLVFEDQEYFEGKEEDETNEFQGENWEQDILKSNEKINFLTPIDDLLYDIREVLTPDFFSANHSNFPVNRSFVDGFVEHLFLSPNEFLLANYFSRVENHGFILSEEPIEFKKYESIEFHSEKFAPLIPALQTYLFIPQTLQARKVAKMSSDVERRNFFSNLKGEKKILSCLEKGPFNPDNETINYFLGGGSVIHFIDDVMVNIIFSELKLDAGLLVNSNQLKGLDYLLIPALFEFYSDKIIDYANEEIKGGFIINYLSDPFIYGFKEFFSFKEVDPERIFNKYLKNSFPRVRDYVDDETFLNNFKKKLEEGIYFASEKYVNMIDYRFEKEAIKEIRKEESKS